MGLVRYAAVALLAASVAGSALAAGNLTSGATLIKINMTPDRKFSTTSIEMETGKAYNLEITKVAGDEWQFRAPDLFSNSYIFQVVVDGKEIKTRAHRLPGVRRRRDNPHQVGSQPHRRLQVLGAGPGSDNDRHHHDPVASQARDRSHTCPGSSPGGCRWLAAPAERSSVV